MTERWIVTFNLHSNFTALLEPAGTALLSSSKSDITRSSSVACVCLLVLYGSLEEAFTRFTCLYTVVIPYNNTYVCNRHPIETSYAHDQCITNT